MIKKILVLLCLYYFSGISQDAMAACSGSIGRTPLNSSRGSLSTPVRNLISRQPVRSLFQKIRANVSTRRHSMNSYSGAIQSSCSGVQANRTSIQSPVLQEPSLIMVREVLREPEVQIRVPEPPPVEKITKTTILISHQFFSDDEIVEVVILPKPSINNSKIVRSIPTIVPKQPSGKQWFNHDGLSVHDHIKHVHGTDTTGMTHTQVLQSRNDYHNKHGAGHPVKETKVYTTRQYTINNCPTGTCPN